jgi:chromosome segregation ATPase
MKTMIGLIVLAVLCLGLGVALFSTRQQAAAEKKQDTDHIARLSNQWVEVDGKLQEQKQVSLSLERDVAARKQQVGEWTSRFSDLTNRFSDLTNKFTTVATTLVQTENSLSATKEEVARRDAKITQLEQQNRDLDQRALELSGAITNLTGQIADTQGKLARSEGNRAFLEQELKRLMAEKAELERQFNDLVLVRAQVVKLREELNISRRLDWIRKGLFAADEPKGAQKLMQKTLAPAPADTQGHYDLNVEVNADGTVRVLPPPTNAPAPPPK